MNIDISKKELQDLRELLYEGRARYARTCFTDVGSTSSKMVELGTKYIRKVNNALKKVHGHDCCGNYYI